MKVAQNVHSAVLLLCNKILMWKSY